MNAVNPASAKLRLVVATFIDGRNGETVTQAGHYESQENPGFTLCGRPVIEKKTTVDYLRCSACYTLTGGRPRERRPAGQRST